MRFPCLSTLSDRSLIENTLLIFQKFVDFPRQNLLLSLNPKEFKSIVEILSKFQ